MKNFNKELIKSIGISILIIIAILLLLTIISYNKISIGKVIPQVESYELNEEIKSELETEEADQNTEIVTTYEIDATDLKNYEKIKKYNKGKQNPFEEDTTSPNNTVNNTVTENKTNSSSTNFYRDEGIK